MNAGDFLRNEISRVLNESALEDCAAVMVDVLAEQMIDNTDSGNTFTGGSYDNDYSPNYAKSQKRPISPVTMQSSYGDQTKRTAKSGKGNKRGVTLSFREDTEIMAGHHTGDTKGGKVRNLMPVIYGGFTTESIEEGMKAIKRRLTE